MFDWLKKKEVRMSRQYLSLHRYLLKRYADRVVLTFWEIEDLLGFSLPSRARLERAWWAVGTSSIPGPQRSDTWVLANRTATPNLQAQSVVFERVC